MNTSDFLTLYTEDGVIRTLTEKLKQQHATLTLKGLSGSMDAAICSAVSRLMEGFHVYITHDKEEAAYFHNDIQALTGREVHLFPTSYKRPYQFEETENANILMRAEILNQVNAARDTGMLLVTYPEALSEKVINRRSLKDNTFTARKGEQVDIEFLAELLSTYGFEPTDFVYEAGQYAVRGGIIDIYSFANELPYRIELFGDEIESIRTFDPVSQLSVDTIEKISIIPNVQTHLLEEVRQSFLEFLPDNTTFWLKDYQQLLDVVDKSFEKASQSFDDIIKKSGDTQVINNPEELFETGETLSAQLKNYNRVEFGNRYYLKGEEYQFDSEPQPSFNKNFEILTDNLTKHQEEGYTNIIAAESQKQIERLRQIFEELDPFLKFQPLNVGLREGFVDKQLEILCYTDHQLFDRYHRYKTRELTSKSKALTLKELRTLSPGDYVTHIDHGVGRFAGMEVKEVNGKRQEAVRLVYRDDDLLYVSIHSLHKISKYTGKEGVPPQPSKLGSPEWENKKKRVKKKVQDIANDLIELYAKRKAAPGFAFSEDSFLQAELESSFIYEDTPDQARATEEVKQDMQIQSPMDRLVCGDVGFGKTEVAMRAAFKAVTEGKQVAVLVPTTILAFQHYRTFMERMKGFPVKIDYINRFRTTREIRETLKGLTEGTINIVIGTHRLVNKDVKFKDLGLLVIDEEQKFGVKVKDRLKEMRVNVDVLTLTATPIPRTLHFSLMGARDLSVIQTPPPNRQPVTTELHEFHEEILRDSISYELRRGGQCFFVHNRISDIDEMANIILRLVPDARVVAAHGQMDGKKLEKIMLEFIEGEHDVLVSTNIIESGLDIPNANTIIINRAHMFGLSDLHQMRGRVGRSNRKAFCYLLTPPTSALSSDARKRLSTLEEFSDLGDGFKVAMRDLDIRGAGNLLGAEQSGFITDLGFDMYHKILDDAIRELKETKFAELFEKELSETTKVLVQDCSIETDLELIIPEDYVSNITERLSLYSQLDNIKTEQKLSEFHASIKDRFGPLPEPVEDLIKTVRLRWLAEKLGFEKLTIKNGTMRAYFVPSDREDYYKSDVFGRVLQFVQKHSRRCRMKEIKNRLMLVIEDIDNIEQARTVLGNMLPQEKPVNA
ncbi:transcription-repair coupling factor [Roseivirga sp. BDSF3-8]|uniref:transcription-repair coupling factor n=1 Tax=Roseivirga sp. BDSF3-8 TaxID=3241598 RepID=UPI0035322E99